MLRVVSNQDEAWCVLQECIEEAHMKMYVKAQETGDADFSHLERLRLQVERARKEVKHGG